MGVLIAMGVFVLSHVVIARTRLKPALIERLGERAYLFTYSALSLVLLGWVIWALVTAERILLWPTPLWSYAFAAITSLVGFVLIGVGALSPNPFSVAFRKSGFDPQRPGAIGWMRHPMVWGLALWGLAHVPANGDWPSLVLFAGSFVFGVTGVSVINRRLQRRYPPDDWQRMTAGRGHVDRNALLGVATGLALWAGLLALHPHLFGANPLAMLLVQLG